MQSASPALIESPEKLFSEVIQLRTRIADVERDVAAQSAQLDQQQQALQAKEQRIEQLLDYILLLRQKRFGIRCERASKDQIALFDESELDALLAELEAQLPTPSEKPGQEVVKPTAPKSQPVRRPLPASLKRVEKIIDFTDDEKAAMGADWVLIGHEDSEQLATIARQLYVIKTRRAKYAPVNDAVPGAEQGIKLAPRPQTIIPKSIAHHSLIADVITSKFVDGLPLYRQEAIFAREAIDLSRQTMSGWVTQLERPLSPLMAAMKQLFYTGRLVQIDETRLQVLGEAGRDNTQQSFMWVYRGGAPHTPVIWYEYAETRSGEVPLQFLYPPDGPPPPPHWQAYVQTDGYAGYNALARQPTILGHAACMAHCRRKFVEATQGRKNTAAAHQVVALIGKLYQIERTVKALTAREKRALRQEHAKPVLEAIKHWLDQKAPQVLPQSLLGKAVHYALGLWPKLILYIEDGDIEIDNNKTENAIRPFVIGRKGFLFSGSPRGARASAMLYSLIESAKANGLEPRAYLGHVFEHLPRAKTEQEITALLPQFLKPEELSG